jgi:hypothetical protein
MDAVALVQNPDLFFALARRQSLPRGASPKAAQARARMAAQVTQSAPVALRPLLAALSAPELVRLRQRVLTTEALTLDLLPPLVVAKILQARSRAVLDMLLAWGKSLRKQAAIAQKAQKRAQQKAYEASRKLLAAQNKAAAAKARDLAAAWLEPSAAPLGGANPGALGGRPLWAASASAPALGALTPPLMTGVALRGPVLRLRAYR